MFFPTKGTTGDAAKALCASCPVFRDCNATAEADQQLQGIWAGLASRERRRLGRGAALDHRKQ